MQNTPVLAALLSHVKKNTLIIAGCIILILFITDVFLIKYHLGVKSILHWDAVHFHFITTHGYEGNSVAFFPTFPMFWRYTGWGETGICFFNVVLFITVFFWLYKNSNASIKELILFISFPSVMYFFIPYAETVFFASSIILILGFKRNNYLMVYAGLFLCSLSRPAFTVMFPAMLITEIMFFTGLRKFIERAILSATALGLGLLITGVIQHHFTGEWFTMFKVQAAWGNKLQMPWLPLRDYGDYIICSWDGIALAAGIISGITSILFLLRRKLVENTKASKEIVFSFLYLAGITLLVLMYRAGMLYSLNRYIFCTPFFFVAICYFTNLNFRIKNKYIILLFILMLLYWLPFGSYSHISIFLKFFGAAMFMFFFILQKSANKTLSKISYFLVVLTGFIFNIIFVLKYLQDSWVA